MSMPTSTLPRYEDDSNGRSSVKRKLAALFVLALVSSWATAYHNLNKIQSERPTFQQGRHIKVFSTRSGDNEGVVDERNSQTVSRSLSSKSGLELVALTVQEQEAFLRSKSTSCGDDVFLRYQEFIKADMVKLATSLWKFCSLFQFGGLYLDLGRGLGKGEVAAIIDHVIPKGKNAAIIYHSDISTSIHGSFLWIQNPGSRIVDAMIDLLVLTPIIKLKGDSEILSVSLHSFIAKDCGERSPADILSSRRIYSNWHLFQIQCSDGRPGEEEANIKRNSFQSDAIKMEKRCLVIDTINNTTLFLVDQTLHPTPERSVPRIPSVVFNPSKARYGNAVTQTTNESRLYNQDLARGHGEKPSSANTLSARNSTARLSKKTEENLEYISEVSETIRTRSKSEFSDTPNFQTILNDRGCSVDRRCNGCLKTELIGSNCQTCAEYCQCYCDALCKTSVPKKFISREITVTLPRRARDPSRLIPKIIHQTWFEDATPQKYPNMSRLIESFKQSGWDHRFYTDEEVAEFLSDHFPHVVTEAYEALKPGAFKADLFRYCVLLIHGGLYADIDIMLQTDLNSIIGPDVGFMVPQDEPGSRINHRMCLWNGLLAAAPGHPFLVKAIETAVNQIRNRFTTADIANEFCPIEEISVIHGVDFLFTSGPCLLGNAVNRVLGRVGQPSFEVGEISFSSGNTSQPAYGASIPGRSIILRQNKNDMGAHRFTLSERNLIVASTDFLDADDSSKRIEAKEHYSNLCTKRGFFGEKGLYKDNLQANENVIFSTAEWTTKKMARSGEN